jgi:two-component system, cell cycle sensor histidine kinase and response regulator CckA
LNGRQLAAELRRRPGLAVLYVSGYAGETISRTGMCADADAFLEKPFTPVALLGRIRLILDAG